VTAPVGIITANAGRLAELHAGRSRAFYVLADELVALAIRAGDIGAQELKASREFAKVKTVGNVDAAVAYGAAAYDLAGALALIEHVENLSDDLDAALCAAQTAAATAGEQR